MNLLNDEALKGTYFKLIIGRKYEKKYRNKPQVIVKNNNTESI